MLGSSIQHNSTARGLASRESEFEALLTDPGAATSISRVSASEFAADDATALAACAEPFLVAGTLTGWRGSERWHSVETLLDAYGDLTFSLAHDVTVTLREYAEYARSTGADCPYYLVERRFEDGRATLLDDFAPPPPFSDDLFRYVPGSRSARYWFCGGPRSGTFLHADPLCTAAWNAVTCGAKRWCASHTLKRDVEHIAHARSLLPGAFSRRRPTWPRSASTCSATERGRSRRRGSSTSFRGCSAPPRRAACGWSRSCRGRESSSTSRRAPPDCRERESRDGRESARSSADGVWRERPERPDRVSPRRGRVVSCGARVTPVISG